MKTSGIDAATPGERMRAVWRSAVLTVHAGVLNPTAQPWYEKFQARAERSLGAFEVVFK